MNTIMRFFVCVIVSVSSMRADFVSHARGVHAGNSGDIERAKKMLEVELVKHPHDEMLLYDTAVADFRCGNYESAAQYFEQSAQLTEEKSRKIEAYFNAGNAQAHLKNYAHALNMYEKVLALDKNHKKAHDNYAVVQKLHEQENARSDSKADSEQDKNSDADDDDSATDNKGGQSEGKGGQSEESSDTSEGEQQKNSGSDDSSRKEENMSSHNNTQDGNEDDATNQSGQDNDAKNSEKPDMNRGEQEKNNSSHNKSTQDNGDDQHDATNKNTEKEYGKVQQHENKPDTASEGTQEREADCPSAFSPASAQQEEHVFGQEKCMPELEGCDKQWMRAALEKCDQQDNCHNKLLLRAMVGVHEGGKNDVHPSW